MMIRPTTVLGICFGVPIAIVLVSLLMALFKYPLMVLPFIFFGIAIVAWVYSDDDKWPSEGKE